MHGNDAADVAAYYIHRLLVFPEESKLHGIHETRTYERVRDLYADDPPQLAEFFATAQAGLLILAPGFNDHIGKHYLAEPSRNLIDLIHILQGFSQDLEATTGIEMTTQPADFMEQLNGYLEFLKRTYGCDIPADTKRLPPVALRKCRVFNVPGAQESWHVTGASSKGAGAEEPALKVPVSAPVHTAPDPATRVSKPAVADTDRKKIYSVFISSTFEDLKEIRKAVMAHLQLTEEYNPIGMEAFTASNESQLDYIREKMEFIDLYVLIIGGRYGSTSPDGTSYTEKEYEMAQQHPGIKTLAFLCADPEHLPQDRNEQDTSKRARLEQFRDRVKRDRMVSFWHASDSSKDIAGIVYKALNELDKTGLRGWVRGPGASSTTEPNRDLELAEKDLLNRELTITATVQDPIAVTWVTGFMGATVKVGIPKLLQMMQPTIQNPTSQKKARQDLESNLCSCIQAKSVRMSLQSWTGLLSELSIHKLINKTSGEEDTITITDTGTEFIRRHPEQTTDLEVKPDDFKVNTKTCFSTF